jgi:PAS domain S-box-containing protein
MSEKELIAGIFLILATGIVAIVIHRLMFKKSIVFKLIAVMTVPLLSTAIICLSVGVIGIKHVVWGAPIIVIIITVAFEIIAKMLQRSLKEMIKTIDALSSGDVDVAFNEKFQKGEHELAKVLRQMNSLTKSLQNIASFANNVGKGDLNIEYKLLGEKDILGQAMLGMCANLQKSEAEKKERQKEDERRNWITLGLAKFAELLRANNDNLEELCQSIVSNLVKYIGANQAGIFILNDENAENHVLELKACYAYERRKFLQKTIELGEGLVGTCFIERQSIYMTSLPKDYIHITSGLGEEAPSALLIVPLKVNEEVYGIIEMAAFIEFEPHVREFVTKVSESIASTIGSVKVNIRTNKLLAKSKLQAEEMANQEEELRQNMEEMQATQEELYRREAEMEKTLEGLSSSQLSAKAFAEKMNFYESTLDAPPDTMIYVADLDKKVVYMNKACLTMLGKTKEDVIGKYCYDVWNVEICKTDRCAIECLKRSGKSSRVEFGLGDMRLTTHASTVKDLDGNDIGYAEVIEDITDIRRNETALEETLKQVKTSEVQTLERMNFYESTLDAPPDTMIYVADLDKKVVYMNKACLTMLGKTMEDVVGKYCYDVWNVEICKTDRCAIECLKRSGKSSRVEFGLGDMRLTTHASLVKDLDGNDIGYAEVIEDITEQTQKAAYNKKEAEQLSTNISKLAEGNVRVDFSITKPNQYTQEEYKNFKIIASNLEQVRDAVKKMKTKSK